MRFLEAATVMMNTPQGWAILLHLCIMFAVIPALLGAAVLRPSYIQRAAFRWAAVAAIVAHVILLVAS